MYTKFLLFYALTLTTLNAVAQQDPPVADNGVYVSDSDFLLHRLKDSFEDQKGCRLNNNRKDYLIAQTKEYRDTFYFDNIWGFRKNGQDWRIYKNEYYKIDCASNKICLYDIPASGQGEGLPTTHYFSLSLSAPVHHVSKHNLISVYHNNSVFTSKIKSMQFTDSIFKWDRRSHTYVFMQWL